ncbi:MAG TPA: M4 family metallopeptidase [Marmoricola sp.]|nr:M4 family metallopeptidase [Marmoricola sp.]
MTLDRDAAGRLQFAGTRAGRGIANPDVTPDASITSAAHAHLDRYGAALGPATGTTFVRRAIGHTVSGVDTVSYTQQVDGVPVIGGDVVVGMGPDRSLRSLAASVSSDAHVEEATVSSAAAARTARGVVARVTGHADLAVSDQGRAILDPAVVQVSLPDGPRTVWRFEVGDGAAVRQLVLVDDRTGSVLLRADLVEQADRVVCDRANVRGTDSTCTTGFARTEASDPSAQPDVNSAFDLSGAVSDFYQQVAGIDLTQLLGVDVGGVKKLASSVRFCPPTSNDGACPYDNAFWNGQQMFYGAGWAGADDVVGHEMTHGVVDQFSELFYWGQSGAINESMADIIGEIIDHRHASTGDSATNWDLGEDSPVGTLRNLANPPAYSQPDRTGSNLYDADPDYMDNGGVHTNSGVGNKTAYLISQGGSFNGQTIAGIDGSDAGLTKTGRLYVDAIERLSSGADFAALGEQLDQSCQDLLAAGDAGFTADDCTAVHQAGLATELATRPAKAAPPADAPTTCPVGTTKRVLLDGEAAPATKFAPVSTGWTRETAAGPSNATSGTASWFAADPGGSTPSSTWIRTNSLRSASSVALPAGQPSYLSFASWYVLDYDVNGYYDGGTVEVGVDGGVPALGSTKAGPWINGPSRTLASGYGNTGAGQPAFSGDSHGWSVSRLDLSARAGHTVRPQFTMRTDDQYGFLGWYVDDVTVYTCDGPSGPPSAPSAPRSVRVVGGVNTMTVSWQPPAADLLQLNHYVVATPAGRVNVARTATSVTVPVTATVSKFQVSVTAASNLGNTTSALVTVRKVAPSLRTTRIGARVRFKGAVVAGAPVVGGVVRIQRRTSSGWTTVKTTTTRSDGTYVAKVRHRTKASYRALFMGTTNVVGTASVVRRR